MKTWRQLTPKEQQEARDWWETHEAIYAPMSDPEKYASIFKETPLPPPWPQPPVDLRGVKPEELPDHDWSVVLVPDSVYERFERGACYTDEDDAALRAEVSRFTGIPAKNFRTNLGKFGEVLLSLED